MLFSILSRVLVILGLSNSIFLYQLFELDLRTAKHV